MIVIKKIKIGLLRWPDHDVRMEAQGPGKAPLPVLSLIHIFRDADTNM